MSAMSLEARAPGDVPCHERGEGEALPHQHGAGVEEEVHALLLTQASDHPDDGPWETAREAGKAVALRWAASRRQSQRRVVDDPDPTVAMAEGSGLSVRHDDDALSRTQQLAIDPVVESRLERFGCETVEEPYPAPRSTQPAQQIRHRRRLVTVGLHDGRSPATQHGSHVRGQAPIDRPAVFHDAMPNAGLL